jgi:atypical dual specificity phosphatase
LLGPGAVYRIVVGRITGKPTNFSWLLNRRIAASGRPMSYRELAWVARQGVRAILSLTEEPLCNKWLTQLNLKYLNIPISDHSQATVLELEAATRFVNQQIASDNPVLVHCAAGVGRTGSVLTAYLIRYENENLAHALQEVRKKRSRSVEERQESALQQYEKWVKDLDRNK